MKQCIVCVPKWKADPAPKVDKKVEALKRHDVKSVSALQRLRCADELPLEADEVEAKLSNAWSLAAKKAKGEKKIESHDCEK